VLFLILHLLGDFYFQSEKLSALKNRYPKYVIIHSLIYFGIFLFSFFIIPVSLDNLEVILFLTLSHFLIDAIKYFLMKIIQSEKNRNYLFFVDQLLHFAFIMVLVSRLEFLNPGTVIRGAEIASYLRLVLAFLLIGKPSNIVFKKVFSHFKPVDENLVSDKDAENTEKTFKNAGAAIGILERILILICLIMGLYSSVGLILTAKSIARYDRISKDPTFSEYYLLGTLSSLLFTIVIYYFCFNIL
jgi:hypothetical protein